MHSSINSLHTESSAVFFSFKINIFEQIIQEYYKSVKSLDPDHDGSDLGPNCLQRSSEDDTGNIANHTRGLANLTLDCLNCIHLGNCCGDQVISSLDNYCDVSCLILEKAYLYLYIKHGQKCIFLFKLRTPSRVKLLICMFLSFYLHLAKSVFINSNNLRVHTFV